MRSHRIFLVFAFLFIFTAESRGEAVFPPAPPSPRFSVGEKLIYQIRYLGMPVGESVSEIKQIVTLRGRSAYHIEVKVKSYRVIDWIYKVRDEHHSYVDTETLASLEYRKRLKEGPRREYEHIQFDPKKRLARYFNEKGGMTDEISLGSEFEENEAVQDQLSCGYFARTLALTKKTSAVIPVHADKRNWRMEVKVGEKRSHQIDSVGSFEAVSVEPQMEFKGIFIRKGKVSGLVSLDAKRIPLTMKVKIPILGNITAELSQYVPGQE